MTSGQIQKLYERMKAGAYKGARVQYQRRLRKIQECKKQGINRVGRLSDRDFLLSGIALYWGEGTKKRRKTRVTNSDPEVIKFTIDWFKKIWKIKPERFVLHVGINKIHKNRIAEVENYWSGVTKIPLEQFRKTTLIKAKNKKVYKNFPIHYGTLTVEVRRSAELHYQIIGLIEGLARRGSSVGRAKDS